MMSESDSTDSSVAIYDLINLSSSDDEDELVQVRKKPKNENYVEFTVPQYSEDDFFEHFRVSKQVAHEIAERFATSEYFHHQAGEYGKLSPYKYTLVFLWFAGHEAASYRDVADRFSISIGALHKIIRKMTYFLSNLSPHIIKWPDDDEKREIEAHFRQNGFPGVIGVIDGTHIKIDKPSDDPDSYLNRKHFFSIQVQIVCNHEHKIQDIFVGFPGSVHDSCVFRASTLASTLAEKCQNYYILGNSGYPCLRNLLTPFRDRGYMTNVQRNYNLKLSKNRYIIEHTIRILKQKFRQLFHLKLRNIEDIVNFIRACSVLHNIALNDNFYVNANYEDEEADDMDNNIIDDTNGIQIRDNIAHNILT